ncbi:MAG: elongation factor P [Bacteroidetes bacterium]|nr:MAG: elongation factor P [Bacteroidota bacterium]
MATTADLSRGAFLRIEGELGQVLDWEHVTPNKTGALYHVKLRNVRTGKLMQMRFRSGENIELERVELKDMQFIYKDGNALACMDTETFEQILIDEKLIGEPIRFLKEGMNIEVSFDSNETAIFAQIPNFVELMITYTEPGIKGDTATNSLKAATLETGAEVRVPLFVENEQKIRVDTRDGSYIERVK